ncbi:adenosylcobinamide-GDP ribazoletransferase [Cognatiyoonia sp.]|uniref:adenosylcobinamide-GDP ribazoletransferase n=1 Tax=Cognatiyoonia sp. TaxID=2211652 RepID=UPI003F6A0B7F
MKSALRGGFLQNHDIKPNVIWHDYAAALGLLTRLRIPVDRDRAMARGSGSAWAYPLVGLVVALIVLLTASAALWIGLDASIAAGLCLLVSIVITGAMHEDGLADSADGLWGGWTVERRLEIMKDSRIGTYGVLALGLSLLLRYAATLGLIHAGVLWQGILIAAIGSRAVMLTLMGSLENARKDGLSRSVGRPATATMISGVALGTACIGIIGGWYVLNFALVAAIASLTCAAIAKRKIGGQTGDILGASQQVSEIALLATALAVLA